jgi:hypothetical protein
VISTKGLDPLEGWPSDPEHKKAMRDVIKQNVNAMMFPKPWKRGEALLASGWISCSLEQGRDWRRTRAASHVQNSCDCGMDRSPRRRYELFFHESEIMINAVLDCLDRGVTVLPIHDCLLVAEPHKEFDS